MRKKKTIGYFAALVVLGLITSSLGPTLPGLAEQTAVSLGQISILFTTRSLGYLLGSLISGRLFDRVPGHRLMGGLLLAVALMLFLTPLMPLLWLLAGVLFLLGLVESGVDVGSNTMLVWLYGDNVGPVMNGMHFFFGAGSFLAPILIAQSLLYLGGIRTAYWLLALLVLPAAVYIIRLPATPIPQDTDEDHNRRGRPGLILLLALFFFLYVGAEVSYGGWIFSYAVELEIASEAVAAYLTSAFWGALTVGRLLSVPLAARLRPRTVLLLDLVGCLLSLGLLLLLPGQPTAVWVGSIGLGLSMAAIFPTTLSLAERHMRLSGQITSFFFVGASLGAMTVPWLIGQLFERIGPQATIQIIFGTLVLETAVFMLLLAVTSRQSQLSEVTIT